MQSAAAVGRLYFYILLTAFSSLCFCVLMKIMDSIANFLSQIKNAYLACHKSIETDYSKMREGIAKILKDHGYIENLKVFKKSGKAYKQLHLDLQYDDSEVPAITSIKRVSKCSQRIYESKNELAKRIRSRKLIIVSTPRGLMSGKEAIKKNLGGEVVCEVY